MAEEMQLQESGGHSRKRKFAKKQGHKKKPKTMLPPHGQKKVKIDKKMKKLFRKRAREYNSDDDEDEEENEATVPTTTNKHNGEEIDSEEPSEGEDTAEGGQKRWKKNGIDEHNEFSEDEGGEEDGVVQPGIMKFTEGVRAFKMAFRNIINKSVSDDSLGPILSGHKKLIADKLAEEEAEKETKGEAKKEKQKLAEKGHVKPANYLDPHEKFLLSVATKGVVKLFNAVNKAQTAQKGLDPSRTKDAKEIKKRTKAAFFSELGKPSFTATGSSAKANARTDKVEDEQPAWAPLQDNYMLTSSKLKNWDKMPDKNVSDDVGRASEDSNSSDED
ncbi:hypothetical protein PIB30_075971 [Stylosanthes scabra]|uniref:RRP15-like protein n=1 Tax=Stylosanthes scabra TaxID=79078 RepID=A0ABU6YQN8_9FABA|nr:hypothetical protein [Stylosanthes scabra]